MDDLDVEEIPNLHKHHLFRACQKGQWQLVNYVLTHGIGVDVTDENGMSALMLAGLRNQKDICALLLDRGADVNLCDTSGVTALMHVSEARYDHDEIVKLFLQRGADVNAMDSVKATALMRLCAAGHEKSVKFLVENGAAVDSMNDNGETALLFASRYGHERIVKYLVDNGADLDLYCNYKEEALFLASLEGHADLVKYFITCGAQLNVNSRRNGDGTTLLMWATLYGHVDLVKYFAENGVDVNACDIREETALMWACRKDVTAAATVLMTLGSDVNMSNCNGKTALIMACGCGNDKLVELLIKHGADVNASDEDGNTPLMAACSDGHNAVLWQMTLSQLSGDDKCARIVGLLLEQGVDTDCQERRWGMSAIMMAVIINKLNCLRKLLVAGSNLDLADGQGNTVFSYAMRNEDIDCLGFLLESCGLLTNGRLKPVHRYTNNSSYSVPTLLLTICLGVFEWELCPRCHFKTVSLFALKSGICPGKIKYSSDLSLSPLVMSFIVDDVDLAMVFLRHLYYYPEDYRMLSTSLALRDMIPNKSLLDSFIRQPISLQDWNFLVISKSISLSGPPFLRHQRVAKLPIPDKMKQKLIFNDQGCPFHGLNKCPFPIRTLALYHC